MLAVVTQPEPRRLETMGWGWIAIPTVALVLFTSVGLIGGAETPGLADISFAP